MSNFTSCTSGVYDCNYEGIPTSELYSCANYNEDYRDMEGITWTVIISAVIMCVMAFGIGSNDAANSWATSVGSGAIKLRTALILGAVCEFSGTVLLGSGVAKTIKEDISDIENGDCWACGYCDSKMSLFQAGMLASLIATATFLLLSSVTSMPVSATHAVVGAVSGMTMSAVGVNCVDWTFSGLGAIMASWVISPLLAGFMAMALFKGTSVLIMDAPNPRDRIVPAIPLFVTFIAMIMTFLVSIKSEDLKDLGYGLQLIITASVGVMTLISSYVFLEPWIKRHLPTKTLMASNSNVDDDDVDDDDVDDDVDASGISLSDKSAKRVSKDKQNSLPISEESNPIHQGQQDALTSEQMDDKGQSENPTPPTEKDDALFCFRVLLVFNAALKSFAHGANDTANATGPFSAVLEIHDHGFDICADDSRRSPIWIMVIAGAFVAFGILSFGHKVITTVGEKLVVIDYHSGFCIELGSCVSVVLATQLGIPVSTTHCQIGAVVGAGLMSSGDEKVHWGLIGKIALTWIITLPFAGLLSVALMEMLRPAFK